MGSNRGYEDGRRGLARAAAATRPRPDRERAHLDGCRSSPSPGTASSTMSPMPVSTGRTSGSCPGYEVDHIVPLACGRPDVPGNMQWRTRTENRRKGAMGCERR
jgi:hypothetical protein